MFVSCPHCGTDLDVASAYTGQTVQCPACQGKLVVPAESPDTSAAAGNRPQRTGWEEKDHANVNFGKSLLIGAAITAGFLLLMMPFRGSRIADIFLDRGWVNYTETFLFCWGLTILFMKWRMTQRQTRAAFLELFPERLGREINNRNVGGFIENVYKVPISLRDSIIVNRIRKALELFESRNNNAEVGAFLNTQSDLDANRSAGSYTLLKVFLWAIPILGFIGTVMGLSTAVGSLAMGDNTDPEALKSAINNLTGGLGIAFDTTLLGLILSILLSFPLALVQKMEDETLTIIDTFCTEKMLPKLNDSHDPVADGLLEKAESIPGLVSSLATAHETFLDNLNNATLILRDVGETLQTRLESHQQTVENSFENAVAKLTETSSEVFLRSNQELELNFKKIANGIDLINHALRDLGQNKIPDEAKKKRGFFRK
ncbi:MAG: MotA/TolQ/ExbB proton channel family protein [Verrucomicrobiota bacterium]